MGEQAVLSDRKCHAAKKIPMRAATNLSDFRLVAIYIAYLLSHAVKRGGGGDGLGLPPPRPEQQSSHV